MMYKTIFTIILSCQILFGVHLFLRKDINSFLPLGKNTMEINVNGWCGWYCPSEIAGTCTACVKPSCTIGLNGGYCLSSGGSAGASQGADYKQCIWGLGTCSNTSTPCGYNAEPKCIPIRDSLGIVTKCNSECGPAGADGTPALVPYKKGC